jgi:hypothetical protein
MTESNLAHLRAYSSNIGRYRSLLTTQLSASERTYLQNRLDEEQRAFETLSNEQPFQPCLSTIFSETRCTPRIKCGAGFFRIML